MTRLQELEARLRELDVSEEALHQERAAVMREFVGVAGGLTEAASRLQADPRTVAQLQQRDEVAFVIYRGPDPSPVIGGHVYGETGGGDYSPDQRWADAHWWRIAKAMRPRIRLLVVVVRGEVRRIWEVMPGADWEEDTGGKSGIPLGERPLTPDEIRDRYPKFNLAVGDVRPARQGLMREYVPL
jgi:hypothetical protein